MSFVSSRLTVEERSVLTTVKRELTTGFSGNIYLIGFMGSGKTTVGRLLAVRLGRRFIDTDAMIEEGCSMRVSEIFEKKGEGHFRRLERRCVESVSRLEGCVVSMGGGAVLDEENWRRIADTGITAYLSYPPEILHVRLLPADDRPLLARHDVGARIAELLAVREPQYRRADLILHFDNEVGVERVVDLLCRHLGLEYRTSARHSVKVRGRKTSDREARLANTHSGGDS